MADKKATNPKEQETATKQVGVRFKPDAITRIDSFVARFKKDDRATVIREIFLLYSDFYEQIEQARIDAYGVQKQHYDPGAEIEGSERPKNE